MQKKYCFIISLCICIFLCCVTAIAADGLSVSEFDYSDVSVTVSGSIGNGGIKTAAVYIIPEGDNIDALSDSNSPVFADVINTNSNGAFSYKIKFSKDPSEFDYGTYDVYVYSKEPGGVLTDSFTYLSPQQIEDGIKEGILNEVKSNSTWQGMKASILGQNQNGEVINDNFAWINPDVSVYNTLNNQDALFAELFRLKSTINTFDDIADTFESVARDLKSKENQQILNQGSKPSVGGTSFGGSSSVMTDTPQKEDEGNSSISFANVFSDMDNHWAKTYATSLAKQGIINGYEDGTYRPDVPVTRAELAKIIVGAFDIKTTGVNTFDDVSDSDWFYSYVNSAAASGIVNGFDGRFSPNNNVTRQDAALMLYRAISLTNNLGIGYTFFADEVDIAAYAAQEVSALAEIGIITGNDKNEFMPTSNLTRAEAAALISRAADYIEAH